MILEWLIESGNRPFSSDYHNLIKSNIFNDILVIYLETSRSSSLCIICNRLKSNLANLSRFSFLCCSSSYMEMKWRDSTLWKPKCMHWKRACSTCFLRGDPRFGAMDLRLAVAKSRASSSRVSPCILKCDASYKLNKPFASLFRLSWNFPFPSIHLRKMSASEEISCPVVKQYYSLAK